MRQHRVVITGIGLVTPIGSHTGQFWTALMAGVSAVRALTGASYQQLPCRIASLVEPYASEYDDQPAFIKYAMTAADLAISDSQLLGRPFDRTKIGVSIGTGLSGITEIAAAQATFLQRGHRRVSPFFIPRILGNMAAGQVSIKYGFMGPNHSASTACATGLHSIGDAVQLIRNGSADAMLAGASEAAICPLTVAGFCQSRALAANFNDNPAKASRPFDAARSGFVLGEGAAVLVLERLSGQADYYAELAGFASTGDAHHIIASHPTGLGARLAMQRALDDACLAPSDIDYINAHATSTPIGDEAEVSAIGSLFAPTMRCRGSDLLVSSSKGNLGHLLGAAGAVETAICALALSKQAVPPTANLDCPFTNAFDFVPLRGRPAALRHAVCNSFGFGGTNASLVLSHRQPSSAAT